MPIGVPAEIVGIPSTCLTNKIIKKMKKILLSLAVIAMVSCTQDDSFTAPVPKEPTVIAEDDDIVFMREEIQKCQNSIDSISRIFPISDTLSGTDPFYYMLQAHEVFFDAKSSETKEWAYLVYMENYNIVMELYNELVNE